MKRLNVALGAALMLSAATAALAQPRPPETGGRAQLTAYLDRLAGEQLARRAQAIAALRTPADMERRKAQVRGQILDLIGGLPEAGPLNARSYGGFRQEGYSVEKITYDSTPGYHVTADVFVPEGRGPFPAVIIAPGHGADGKAGNYAWGGNLAKAGILVLAYDVVGEGERWQHYDPETGLTKADRPTGEHSADYWAVLPTGDHVARYFIADGVRGLDYLASRKDVDASRLGAFGCSGGGTVTAYLAALDARVKATAVACYMNDFAHLLAGPGNQDGEQTLPWFLERGLDLPDWAELAAPRPYAVVSTTEDMFPYAGAKAAVDELQRVWGLYGAQDRLSWIVGPGGHGALAPISSDIVAFFTKWLKDDVAKRPFTAERPPRPEDVLVTPTGQLSTSFGGETIRSLNARRAAQLAPAAAGNLAALQAKVRQVTRASANPGGAPPASRLVAHEDRPGYSRDQLKITVEGVELDAVFATPTSPGRKRTLVLMSSPAQPAAAVDAQLARLTRDGWAVLSLTPRGVGGTEEIKAAVLGDWNLIAARAFLVGKTPIGMRTDDAIRAVDWLVARPEVDAKAISLYGVGGLAPVVLHAAVLDPRVAGVFADSGVVSYREAVERPLTRNMPEITPPGVLRAYDLADLARAIAPRPVSFVAPVNGVGEPLRQAEFERAYAGVAGVRWLPRGGRDVWPVLGAP